MGELRRPNNDPLTERIIGCAIDPGDAACRIPMPCCDDQAGSTLAEVAQSTSNEPRNVTAFQKNLMSRPSLAASRAVTALKANAKPCPLGPGVSTWSSNGDVLRPVRK